ncbi:hypothetical protein F7725_028340 [Dissostichus mawsoni]|uniref:PDZ domain-containing protein n=1 Tax=Dissostichus mawsoni TaxID=36200 RepID=A0A7J5XFG1_DISMA|nr:hypothetical protein F7725_028340 [Dissostichus mawsoni]
MSTFPLTLTPQTVSDSLGVGDRIVSINSQSVDGLSHSEAVTMLKNSYGKISLKGAAAVDGRLKRGDQILSVNGESLQGATHEQAVSILKRQRGTVSLDILS